MWDTPADQLVSLNTSLLSPALAEAFLIPYMALEEAPGQPQAQQLVDYAAPRAPNEPQGFVRYHPYPEEDRLFRQPSTSAFEGSLGGRGQVNGVSRTPFAERLPAAAAQHLSSARDAGHPGRPLAGMEIHCWSGLFY